MKKLEARNVSPDWEHPKNSDNSYVPLLDFLSYNGRVRYFEDGLANWNPEGNKFFREDISYEDSVGPRPTVSEHMPNWSSVQRKNVMMYDVSKNYGQPMSPSFPSPEELARWLAENKTTSSGYILTYAEWLEIATRNDIEDDNYYEIMIMLRAGMMAAIMGNPEIAASIGKSITDICRKESLIVGLRLP